MEWMKIAKPLALLLGVGLVAACEVEVDDDDDDASDDDASDDDMSDDDMSDDDASDDDMSDDDMSDDDMSDDDTSDDSFVTILQQGTAALTPPGGPYDTWTGDEAYNEYVGASTTCDISYLTDGVGSAWCDFCEFGFDVVYTVVADNSTGDCLYVYAPSDGETLSMAYYNYDGYGFMLYYVGGYGPALWGYAAVGGDQIDYYYAGYYY